MTKRQEEQAANKLREKGRLNQLKQQQDIAKAQKQASDSAFKQNARLKALDIAQYLKPREPRTGDKASLKKFNEWEVTKESEKIYQWLIKVLK